MADYAFYDLDKTLVRRATYTPFLIFAARRLAPWRLAFLPVWVLMMLGYRAGLYSRGTLKAAGMRLMVGRRPLPVLEENSSAFAAHHIAGSGWNEAVLQMLEDDRRRGARLVIATAAFEFYAIAFARQLQVDTVIATRWDGERIRGGNCYGERKRERVQEYLGDDAGQGSMRFVSDSFADAPLLNEADEACFVTDSPSKAQRASAQGWTVISPRG